MWLSIDVKTQPGFRPRESVSQPKKMPPRGLAGGGGGELGVNRVQ
jgi:hypothetical protein